MRTRGQGWLLSLFAVIIGVFVGNAVGDALQGSLPFLAQSGSFSLDPVNLSLLDVFALSFFFSLRLNLTGALLGLLAFIWIRKV